MTTEKNIKLIIEYEGTRYKGMQFQPSLKTIQGELETAILNLTGESLRITAAGRTDAGVHARGQVVNFKLSKRFELHSIKMGLNYHLPEDISVTSAEIMPANFSARFDATQRVYRYYISPKYTALMRNFCWQAFLNFDIDLMNSLAKLLIGDHDFTSFSRVNVKAKHKRCIIEESYWKQENDIWIYHVAANRFLHGMVRTIVGTMMDVAFGKTTISDFKNIFASQNRLIAGPAAPAKGLVLEAVKYEQI